MDWLWSKIPERYLGCHFFALKQIGLRPNCIKLETVIPIYKYKSYIHFFIANMFSNSFEKVKKFFIKL